MLVKEVKIMSLAKNNEKGKAKEQIYKGARSLYSAKLTLPLGNPNLKLVHTNQFLWIATNASKFGLENFEDIANALTSIDTRFTGYTLNRWYIEGTTITNNGKDAKIDLNLNPFASSMNTYRDAKKNFTRSYSDVESQVKQKNVSSVKRENTSLVGGEGSTINNLVAKIVGKETNELKKAKAIHKWLQKNVTWVYYRDPKYKTPEKCYKNRKHLNCSDTSILTRAMMSSAGITCYIVHGGSGKTGHYWTRLRINNKDYNSDATSHSRGFNKVWLNLKVNRKCNKYPC